MLGTSTNTGHTPASNTYVELPSDNNARPKRQIKAPLICLNITALLSLFYIFQTMRWLIPLIPRILSLMLFHTKPLTQFFKLLLYLTL